MNTIYWRMNATQGGANLHPGVNLLPGANLHPGANCAHEHGLSLFLFLKKDFLNSPSKIFFKMAAKLSKTTAIRREKTPNPELTPLFFRNDWTRCVLFPC